MSITTEESRSHLAASRRTNRRSGASGRDSRNLLYLGNRRPVERSIPGLYEPPARSAAIDPMSRDLQSGRRLDAPLSAVSIDEMVDSELSTNVEDEEGSIDRWTEAVDTVLELGGMF